MTKEILVLVDENDNPVGLEEKVKCHLPDGKLHRAFTVLLFNEKGELLLTKRSHGKMLWPGDWDGTVASHPRQSENYVSSAERRLPEEVGISCKLDYLFKFEYHVPYKDIGSENEVCGTLLGIVTEPSELHLAEDEISAVKWIGPKHLEEELQKNLQNYCPWMIVALYLLSKDKNVLKRYNILLEGWSDTTIQEMLENSIKFHFPEKNWRLINQ